MDLQEDMTVEVLMRLPLKSIARCKTMNKKWRSLIDSDFFRDKFISRNSSSSISWSVIQMQPHKLTFEIIGHHGCKTWGLTRSPGSFVSFLPETTIKKILVLSCTDGLVLIYAEASDGTPMYYVGNPLFQEWFRIPLPHSLSLQDLERLRKDVHFSDNGLVTKMQSGIVVSYKVVWLFAHDDAKVDFMIYSSDTGMWETRKVTCLHSKNGFSHETHHKSIALNGILHWLPTFTISFIAYDFYNGSHVADDGCSIIEFPDTKELSSRCRKSITTSKGSIVYLNVFGREKENRTLLVWRLVKYIDGPEAWQLLWEVSLASLFKLGIDYFPVVMHPLNSEIIYLWSMGYKMLILFNLRTHVFSLHEETAYYSRCMDGLILSFNGCNEYMYKYHIPEIGPNHLLFSQYVLPSWFHRSPSSAVYLVVSSIFKFESLCLVFEEIEFQI